MIAAHPQSEVSVAIVWMDVLAFDSAKSVRKAMRIFGDDPRVRHFWDPENRLGHALAPILDLEPGDLAWDVYLFYGRDAVWLDPPPRPEGHFHQLTRYRQNGRYRSGEDLVRELRAGVGELLAAPGRP